MNLPTLTQLARQMARFSHYEDGNLWYEVVWLDESLPEGVDRFRVFAFPIAVADAGGGKFLPDDKALTFLRWMRPHLEMLQKAQAGE